MRGLFDCTSIHDIRHAIREGHGFRAVLIKGAAPVLELLAGALAGIGLTWVVTWPLFRQMPQYSADVL